MAQSNTAPKNHAYDDAVLRAEILKLFGDAESAIKKIEHETGLDFPSVNQLRYVGHHVVNYLNNNDIEELDKARRHCKRAIYDANDIGIQFYIEEINLFKNDYKDIVIADVLPEYVDFLDDKNAAEDFLERGKRAFNNRDDFYTGAVEHYDRLKYAARTMDRYREELNKKVMDRRNSQIFAWAGTIIGLIGTVLGIGALF